MLFRLIFCVFLKIPIKTCTGAQSTKITNLLFFDSRLVTAISPRVLQCFLKLIFLDFEVRNNVFTQVFEVSPLKNTRKPKFCAENQTLSFRHLFGSNSELLGRLGASLGRFWALLGHLGAVLGGVGVVLGSFGWCWDGEFPAPFSRPGAQDPPKSRPRPLQNTPAARKT